MQTTKNISNQLDKDKMASITTQKIEYLPAVICILFGIATLINAYQIASLIIFYDPNHEIPPFIVMISLGFIHLLASIASSILWVRNIKWSRYSIMILAIISTVILLYYIFSSFYFLLIFFAAMLDVYLFYFLFMKKGSE